MNKAKSYKILILLLTCFLSFACLFASLSVLSVKALSTEGYFLLNGSYSEKVVFEEDVLKATIKEGDVLAFKNKLDAKDLTLNVAVPSELESFSVNIVLDSYSANGNENSENGFDTQIKNVLEIDLKNGKANLNGATEKAFTLNGDLQIVFSVENNYLTAKVEGVEIENSSSNYFKVKEIDQVPASVNFAFLKVASESIDFKIISVGQKTGDDSYTQTFVLTDGKLTPAKPIVYLSENFFNKNSSDITVVSGYQYKLSVYVLSVTGKGSETYSFASGDNANNKMIVSGTNVTFKLSTEDYINGVTKSMNFNVVDGSQNVIKTYDVKVVADLGENGVAPEYKNSASVVEELENFKKVLLSRTKAEYEIDGQTVVRSVRVGAGEYLEIPSLKGLVEDNATAYENLTMTIRYRNKDTSWSNTSDKKIPLSTAGTYEFFVLFKDLNGNQMVNDDFINEDDGVDSAVLGKYGDFMFSFTVLDDAPFFVEASKQGKGFKGIEFNASGFTIKASDYTSSYALFYRKDANASWVEIPQLKDVENNYSENGFTYKDIENIAFDGKLSFTPDRLGEFKIVCTVSSNSALAKSQSAEAIIYVEDVPTTVVPYNHWFENNVWSILFLSVGTISLIAIIVLLVKKPKDGDQNKGKK